MDRIFILMGKNEIFWKNLYKQSNGYDLTALRQLMQMIWKGLGVKWTVFRGSSLDIRIM